MGDYEGNLRHYKWGVEQPEVSSGIDIGARLGELGGREIRDR